MNKEKRKRRRTRKIILLLIWALFLFTLLTSSTYAWFSVNRVVSIESLDIHVDVKGGLEISTNAIDWTNSLQSIDIVDAHNTYSQSINQLPETLKPVSSGGIVNDNHFLNMYYGIAQQIGTNIYYSINSKIDVEKESFDDSGKFIAFDAFLRLQSDATVYLTNYSGTVVTDEIEGNGIENAIRVGFILQGHTALESSPTTAQNMLNGTTDDLILWEPNYDTHTENGVEHAMSIYGINTTTSGGDRIIYDGIISEFGYEKDVNVGKAKHTYFPEYFKEADIDIATKNGFDKYETFIENGERGIYKIRIYIWIEGQDVDCEDHASVGNVLFNLGFTTLPQ